MMSRLIEVSDELFSNAMRIADQQSLEPGDIVEYWARVGMAVIETANAPTDHQPELEGAPRAEVVRRLKQFMREASARGIDIKRLMEEGRS